MQGILYDSKILASVNLLKVLIKSSIGYDVEKGNIDDLIQLKNNGSLYLNIPFYRSVGYYINIILLVLSIALYFIKRFTAVNI